MIGLFYEREQHAVNIRDTCDILHAGMLSRSLKIKLCMQPEQIKALELCLTGRDVRTILPTGYGKSWINQVFFGKAFRLEPECERVSDFVAYKH